MALRAQQIYPIARSVLSESPMVSMKAEYTLPPELFKGHVGGSHSDICVECIYMYVTVTITNMSSEDL